MTKTKTYYCVLSISDLKKMLQVAETAHKTTEVQTDANCLVYGLKVSETHNEQVCFESARKIASQLHFNPTTLYHCELMPYRGEHVTMKIN